MYPIGSRKVASKYSVLTYGNEKLRKKASLVKKVDAEIRQLAKDLLETMYTSNGVGLAAAQVGRPECICVIDVPVRRDEQGRPVPPENPHVPMPLVLINPVIVETGGVQKGQEGCLSFPEIFVDIKRPAEVIVAFTSVDEKDVKIKAAGLLARAILHEIDHLNGVLLVDHMSAVQKIAHGGKLRRLKKAAQ
ncbi:MAG: peptide deformylase [Verrucomicrobia bacterium]|nr:peptide deformylase [Verrucomicrobiota bacterium]